LFGWQRRGECGEMGRGEMRKGRLGRVTVEGGDVGVLLELCGVGGRDEVSFL
jgi:hypothetical protein